MENSIQKIKKKKSPLRIFLGWLVYLVFLAALVWGTPYALSKILHTPYPIAAITSGSMWPALKQGDVTLIQGASSRNDIKVGDIAVYKNLTDANEKVIFLSATGAEQGASFTIHRVVRLEANDFITKGDANDVEDSPVDYGQLVGKAFTIGGNPIRIPYLGEISMMFKK